jgi:hypothetical protein
MDEAAVQAAIAKAVKEASEGLTTKFTAQVTDLTAKLETANSETVKARAAAHRFAVLAPFEAAIKAGIINAAAKDEFIRMRSIADDKLVLDATPKLAEEFIDSYKDMKKFKGPGAPKRVAMGEDTDPLSLKGRPTAEVMNFMVEQRVVKTGGKVNCFDDLEAASKYVLASNRDLALQYFADPQAPYDPPAAKSDAA